MKKFGGGEGVTKLCQTSLGYFKTFNISPVKKYRDKYSLLKYINP